MSTKGNKKKAEQLGMPYGTASHRLRKMILFSLIKKTKQDICFHCGEHINNIDNLSIEHKIPWIGNDTDLFWNLDNIAFSHLKCNVGNKRPNGSCTTTKMDKKEYQKLKSKQLGMAFGTANGKLRKSIMFDLIKKAHQDNCFQCGKRINDIDDLSVEHKKPWLNNGSELFWNLDNIAFSHTKCNYSAATTSNKIHWPKRQAWCGQCKRFKNKEDFAPSKFTKKGRSQLCRKCNTESVRFYRAKQKTLGVKRKA